MTKRSLAEAKAHLSELVDQAEHKGQRIVILRHGRPAAAIVPVDVAIPPRRRKRRTARDVEALFTEAARLGDPKKSAVDEVIRGRR